MKVKRAIFLILAFVLGSFAYFQKMYCKKEEAQAIFYCIELLCLFFFLSTEKQDKQLFVRRIFVSWFTGFILGNLLFVMLHN